MFDKTGLEVWNLNSLQFYSVSEHHPLLGALLTAWLSRASSLTLGSRQVHTSEPRTYITARLGATFMCSQNAWLPGVSQGCLFLCYSCWDGSQHPPFHRVTNLSPLELSLAFTWQCQPLDGASFLGPTGWKKKKKVHIFWCLRSMELSEVGCWILRVMKTWRPKVTAASNDSRVTPHQFLENGTPAPL